MFIYIPFSDVRQAHIVQLTNSLLAAPADIRPDLDDLLRAIMTGAMRLFECGDGVMLLGKSDNRLMIYAFAAETLLGKPKTIAADLKRLAADWECDMVETLVFDPRITSVIEKVGGRVESVTMILPVE